MGDGGWDRAPEVVRARPRRRRAAAPDRIATHITLDDGSKITRLVPDASELNLPRNGHLIRNLARINADGTIRWYIQASTRVGVDTYFNPPTRRGTDVYAVDFWGFEYRIDIETGAAVTTGAWSK